MKKILIALDATAEAEEVIEGAMALDPRGAVEVHVVTVIPPLMGGISGMDGAAFAASWPLREMEEQLAQDTAKNIRERAAAYGIAPDQVNIRTGRPASEIKACAKEIGADLIVIGTHARGALSGILLGSTANGVLHGSPCDVLTVHVANPE